VGSFTLSEVAAVGQFYALISKRDLEAETYEPKRMLLMIQVAVFLKVLISCFLGSELVWLRKWASQPK
jgi:hypothetical protein